MLYNYALGEQVSAQDEEILLDVLRHHPSAEEKIGSGIAYFTVRTPLNFPTARCFWLHRIDGSGTDFSYCRCLRPASKWKTFTQTCRHIIADDIVAVKLRAFGAHAHMRCPITGKIYAFEEMHVDHRFPRTFNRLLRDFLLEQGVDFERVKLISQDDLAGRVFADAMLATEWRDYHRAFADLWVISRDAHVQLTRERILEKLDF